MTPTPFAPRLFFAFMCGPGSYDDLKELLEPIRGSVSGIIVTYHGSPNDIEALYLEDIKGAGQVICLPFPRRHDLSRNVYLHCSGLQDGDWVLSCDSKERITTTFLTAFVIPFLGQFETVPATAPNLLIYHTKPILYQYHESLQFNGSPHEGLSRRDGQTRAADITSLFPDEADVRPNVRARTRGEFHWIFHYLRYHLYPWGSNHVLLGWENRQDQLPAREARRLAFRSYLRSKGYPLTLEGVKALFSEAPLPDETKKHINGELILHDYYRHTILGDTTLTDRHDPSSIRPL